jgi:hypothetical protein
MKNYKFQNCPHAVFYIIICCDVIWCHNDIMHILISSLDHELQIGTNMTHLSDVIQKL